MGEVFRATRDAERARIIAALRRWARTMGHHGSSVDYCADMLEAEIDRDTESQGEARPAERVMRARAQRLTRGGEE